MKFLRRMTDKTSNDLAAWSSWSSEENPVAETHWRNHYRVDTCVKQEDAGLTYFDPVMTEVMAV